MEYNLITILGPTATGKTKLAARIAAEFSGEIISADSRQVYRRMDIGTGKDLADYVVDGVSIPFHLIDVINPEEEFDLYKYILLFNNAYAEISGRLKTPILCGGTGMYLSAVLQNYKLKHADFSSAEYEKLNQLNIDALQNHLLKLNPALHNTTDLLDKERIIKAILVAESNQKDIHPLKNISPFVIGVKLEREEIKRRITARLKQRLENGMIEEVKDFTRFRRYL